MKHIEPGDTTEVTPETAFKAKDGKTLRLNERQLRVVELAVTTNMTDREIAAEVGYKGGEEGRASVWKTLRKAHVQEYMQRFMAAHMGTKLATKSLRVLEHLLDNGVSERVRMETAQDLLDRVGARTPDRREVTHRGGVSINIDLGE